MKSKLLASLLAVISISAVASSSIDDFKGRFTKAYPKTQLSSVETTAIPGVYEVTMGRNIAYVSEDTRYFMFGTLYDMKTSTDLTANKRELAARVDFSKLPLKNAIVIKNGNGKRSVAVFTDPDCPYCLQLHKELSGVKDATIYVFLFPLDGLHPQASAKAKAIWCAKDKSKALDDWFLMGKLPDSESCDTPIDSNVKLGESFGINGTPTLIFKNGKLAPGTRSAADINKLLDEK